MVAETWLKKDGNEKEKGEIEEKEITRAIYEPRPYNQGGGGLCCVFNDNLKLEKGTPPKVTSMEILEMSLVKNSIKITLVVIYRSEKSTQHWYTMETFFDELNEIMAHYNLVKNEVIICGDFNIHVNKPDATHTKKLNEILEMFGLTQHIHEPTQERGNTLDLLITCKDTILKDFTVGERLSDHNNIIFKLNLEKPLPKEKTIHFRKIKSINKDVFKKDITHALKDINMEGERTNEKLNNLVQSYNKLTEIFNEHAPIITRTITVRENVPWNINEIKPELQKRKKLEKKWLKSKLQVDKHLHKQQK